jgi:hypothetical protein
MSSQIHNMHLFIRSLALNISKSRSIAIIALMLIALMALVPTIASAQTSGGNGFTQGLCSGTGSNSTGVIPNSILTGQSNGEQQALLISLLIIFTMFMIVALLWIISNIMNLNVLKNLAKAEIGEIIITVIIVLVFIGTFSVASSGISSTNVVHAAGTSFGKGIFVDDCTYLADSSYVLIPEIFGINVVRWVISIVTSLKVTITPTYFGFIDSPFQGFILFNKVLALLEDITGAFLLLNMGTVILLGIIYALFPIFLYAGVVLRTLPWTRAAGGAFLGLFVGFYIMFPILLHVMLSSYIPMAVSQFPNGNLTTNQSQFVSSMLTLGGSVSAPSFLEKGVNYLATISFGGSSTLIANGLVNGYIVAVIEPAMFTFLAIVIAFIISFDLAEATGDLLGAPSLRASGLFNKLI